MSPLLHKQVRYTAHVWSDSSKLFSSITGEVLPAISLPRELAQKTKMFCTHFISREEWLGTILNCLQDSRAFLQELCGLLLSGARRQNEDEWRWGWRGGGRMYTIATRFPWIGIVWIKPQRERERESSRLINLFQVVKQEREWSYLGPLCARPNISVFAEDWTGVNSSRERCIPRAKLNIKNCKCNLCGNHTNYNIHYFWQGNVFDNFGSYLTTVALIF